jgi:hypothetical protein
VALEGIDSNGKLMFNATAYVPSPRRSYSVRSDVLLVVLKELRAAGLPLSNPSTMVLRDVPMQSIQPPHPVVPVEKPA